MRRASLAAEIDPASDWCQRWGQRRHSWRHRSEGGFDASLYTVEPIGELVAKSYVIDHHYSGTYPAASRRFGLFLDDLLVGVAVFGIPVRTAVLTGVFPDLEPYRESLELSRFVLTDALAPSNTGVALAPANSESWFLARCFEELVAGGLRGVVAFSDPVPRRVDNRVLFPGHIGTIYQASNARFCGRGRARDLLIVPKAGGVTLNERSLAKVRGQDRGHDHVERRLVEWGARPMRAGEVPGRWLEDALEAVGALRIRHGGNLRYAFALGTPAMRRRVAITPAPRPYPKALDHAA